MLAIPVVTNSFNVISWMLAEIKKMSTNVKKLITCHRMHHPRADIKHLYVKRENGGRGLIQLKLTYKTTTVGIKKYLDTTTHWMIQLVNTH